MSARERYQPGWWERWERCLLVRGWLGALAERWAWVGGLGAGSPGRGGSGGVGALARGSAAGSAS